MSEAPRESAKPSIEDRISAALAPAEEAPAPEQARPERAFSRPERDDEAPVEAAEAAEGAEAVAEQPEGDEAPDSAAQEAEQADEDVIEIGGTFADLAEHLGVDVADLYKITVPIQTPDGRRDITIGEWKDGYQSNELASKARRELEQARTQFAQERDDLQKQALARITEAAGLADQMQEAMLAPYSQVDWATLREEDPMTWTAKRQELMEAQQRVAQMRQGVQGKIQDFQRELSQQQEARRVEMLQRESAALADAIPEFRNPETAQAETAALRKYLTAQGFTGEEVDSAYDHRLIVMARKARLYDESLGKATAATKKVLKIAKKTLTPGAKQSRTEQRNDARRGMRAALRKSGKVDDAARLIRDMLE